MATPEDLINWFSHHPPTIPDVAAYEAIREEALEFAKVIISNTESSADQTVALRKVREAMMAANQARACNPTPVIDVPKPEVNP